jgi:hypothetical protein
VTGSPKPELAPRGVEAALYRQDRGADLGDRGLGDPTAEEGLLNHDSSIVRGEKSPALGSGSPPPIGGSHRSGQGSMGPRRDSTRPWHRPIRVPDSSADPKPRVPEPFKALLKVVVAEEQPLEDQSP